MFLECYFTSTNKSSDFLAGTDCEVLVKGKEEEKEAGEEYY